MEIIIEKDYKVGFLCFLDDDKKVLLDFAKCFKQHNLMLSDVRFILNNATSLKKKNDAYYIKNYKYLPEEETEKYVRNLFLEFESGEIKEQTYCCLNHYGKYEDITKTYQKLLNMIKENNYKIVGIPTERFLSGRWNKGNETEYVTKIMIPVQIN